MLRFVCLVFSSWWFKNKRREIVSSRAGVLMRLQLLSLQGQGAVGTGPVAFSGWAGAAQRLLWPGIAMGCSSSCCSWKAGWWDNTGGKTPSNPSPCCIFCAVGARWVSCKPRCAGTGSVWTSPHALVQLSASTPARSVCWVFWTSASLGILLCSWLSCFSCAPGASVAATCVFWDSEREAHTPWWCACVCGKQLQETNGPWNYQRKEEKRRELEQTALHPQPAPLSASLMHWQIRYSFIVYSFMMKTGEAGKMSLSSLFGWPSVKLHWKDRFPGGSYKEVLLH